MQSNVDEMKKEERKDSRDTFHGEVGGESSDEHTDDGTDLGAVQIHNNVISSIARTAALKIPGVAEMSGTFVDGLAGMIGKKPVDHGIHVEFVDNVVLIELHVTLDFGVRIPHVAWQIQNEVKQTVEQMTGKTVRHVNVVVQGLRFPEKKGLEAPEGEAI